MKTLYCKGEFEIINERVEVQQYLQGKNLHRDIEYRICLLLAKWYYEQGYTTVEGIREQLKNWAKENRFYFEVAMNPVAARVIDDKMKLQGDYTVYISDNDINEIKERFDNYYERLVALGVLAYAKVYADKNGEFKLSHSGVSRWLGINLQTVTKYIDMLERLKYIKKVKTGTTKSWYQKTVAVQLNRYRILVPYENTGTHALANNNIAAAYDEIFDGCNYDAEEWYPIPGFNDWYEVSNMNRVKAKEREIGLRLYPEKIIRPFKSKSGKLYANLTDESGKQRKLSIEKLLEISR